MKTLIAIVALVAAIVAVGAWQFAGDGETAVMTPGAAAPAGEPGDSATTVTAPATASLMANNPVEAPPAGDVARLIVEANGADAKKRVDAIAALARAPRAQALPALHRIATNGEPQVDKPAAVNSLRELALGQGDRDGKVREAIREVLYHDDGQNPDLLVVAQDALDVVEESEMK
jgi:hypothetical protein